MDWPSAKASTINIRIIFEYFIIAANKYLFCQQLYIPHGFNGYVLIICAYASRDGEEADKEPEEEPGASQPIENL